jgi:hypothetical protein
MPIPKALRHFYRGKAYEAFVTALLDRAGNACEQCRAPNRARVFRLDLKQFSGWWWSEASSIAYDPMGNPQPHFDAFAIMEHFFSAQWRGVKIVVGPAHLNNTPGDYDLSHSKALCQMCHLRFDLKMHVRNSRRTRQRRKDGARPLLADAREWGAMFESLARQS